MLYRLLARPLLYRMSAETAHRFIVFLLLVLQLIPGLTSLLRALVQPASKPVRALGLTFPNPVGMAAGFDKDGRVFDALSALGFGFVEIGTITHQAQAGNPLPRLFRLPKDRALINRMGFNNHGALEVARRLKARGSSRRPLLGINIGKTKVVPPEEATSDYRESARLLGPYADYFVVNVSSPNTPGLRDLQAVSALGPILTAVREALDEVVPAKRVPLLVKIAPDLATDDIIAVADLALELGLDGIIATNTTIARDGLSSATETVQALGAGGLSGAPLKEKSLALLRTLRERVGDRLVLIAAGGIESTRDAQDRLTAGATLVQIYSALVYEGPSLPRRIARGLSRL